MSETQQEHAPEQAAVELNQTIGQVLREVREARGESVADVAYALKLTSRQVEAMETEQYDLLPGPAFVRGFLRNYARHLGVDADAIIAALHLESDGQAVKLAPVRNAEGVMPNGGEARKALAPAVVVTLGMSLIILLGWYFDWFKVDDGEPAANVPAERSAFGVAPDELPAPSRAEEMAAPVPAPLTTESEPPASAALPTAPAAQPVTPPAQAATPPQPAATALVPPGAVSGANTAPVSPATSPSAAEPVQPSPAAAPAEAETGAATGEGLVFKLEGESWIQVRDRDGAIILTALGTPGSTRSVQGNPPFSLIVGNAARVSLTFNGRAVDMVPHTGSGGVARLRVE